MITSDDQLTQAIEQVGRMYRALAALKREVSPVSPRNFGLLAEGPLEEIRRLEEAIDAYTGKVDAAINDSDVWLSIFGPNVSWPEAPTIILTAFLDALRKGVQAVAEYITTGGLTTRPTNELKRACDLRVTVFQPGSLRVGIKLPIEIQPELFDQDEPSPARKA